MDYGDYRRSLKPIEESLNRIVDERDYNSAKTVAEMQNFFREAIRVNQWEEKRQQEFLLLMSVCVNWGQNGIPLEEAAAKRKRDEEQKERLNIFTQMMNEGIRRHHINEERFQK